MITTFTCLQCGCIFPCNPRVKDQRYCNAPECRRASRRAWKKKRATDKSYRDQCKDQQKRWRENRPAHQYQKEYRERHPDYERRNRELQSLRNRKRKKGSEQMIVKRNMISTQPSGGGTYALMPVKDGKIVKRNTLMVRMQVLSGEAMILAQNSG